MYFLLIRSILHEDKFEKDIIGLLIMNKRINVFLTDAVHGAGVAFRNFSP